MTRAIHDPLLIRMDGADPSSVWSAGRARSVAIVGITVGLMGIGAVMTFSARARFPGDPQLIDAWSFWATGARQLFFVLGGLIAMLLAMGLPYRIWSARGGVAAVGLLLLAFGLMLLVYVPGVGLEVKGARRWTLLGPESLGLRLQPSEVMKLALPIFLAAWMSVRGDIRRFWSGLLPAVAVAGACAAVVGIEDFGTAALLAAVTGLMLIVGGARWWHVGLLAMPGVVAFGGLLMSRAHRLERLTAFQDIWADPEGRGYQAIQSLCAIASGGWWGRGLGNGVVKGYLPEAHNDFIFAVICEELGLVGGMAVIGLLVALMWQALRVVSLCPDPFGRLLAFGIAVTLGLQAAMNIGVVTVSLPTKGISLPLVSAGGSGAVCLGAMVGVLAAIARQNSMTGVRKLPEHASSSGAA